VFMQFNRDEQGVMTPLPRPSIDTGMGLERLASVLQGKLSNFDTDLFRPLIDEAAALANVEYGSNHDTDVSLRIIADHARATTFLISDGVLPSNEGRGYVLRKIMRRAILHGRKLGLMEPFLFIMAGHVTQMMMGPYPELVRRERIIGRVTKGEEVLFARTIVLALDQFDRSRVVIAGDNPPTTGAIIRINKLRESAIKPETGGIAFLIITGNSPEKYQVPQGYKGTLAREDAFMLYDTFGLPLDLIKDFSEDVRVWVDESKFNEDLDRQRQRARASWKGAEKKIALPLFLKLAEDGKTVFDGYTQTTSADCKISALVVNGEAVGDVQPGARVEIVLDHTPFYAEAGGQVGDVGHLMAAGSDHEVAHVTNAYYPVSGLIVHRAEARDTLRVGDMVTAKVDVERRDATRRNHTATHLLHAALRRTLGTHVKQAGSLVAPDRLRFDFTHYAALDGQDLLDIEDLVNEEILKNEEVVTKVMDLDEAVSTGAMALFGEKYADQVRVLTIDDFSKELCGGTHVRRTGDIGLFKIVSEGSVAAGTRRIEAVTGEGVLKQLRQASETLALLAASLRAKPDELLPAVEKLTESEKKLRKELEAQQMKRAASEAGDLAKEAQEVKGVRVISARVEVTDRAAMRQMVDDLRAKLQSGVIVLGSVADGKVSLIAAVTKDLTNKLDAGKIVKQAAALVEGSGGGRKDLAEAGGKNPAKLDESLRAVPSIIEGML